MINNLNQTSKKLTSNTVCKSDFKDISAVNVLSFLAFLDLFSNAYLLLFIPIKYSVAYFPCKSMKYIL